MKVGTARAAAADWVTRYAAQRDGFIGAYFIGSTKNLPDDAVLPPQSDIDVAVVISDQVAPLKPGKVLHNGALIEITLIPLQRLSSADEVLGDYHLAPGLEFNTIIADPTGHLQILQSGVACHFTEETFVRKRCRNALEKIEKSLRQIDLSAPWPDLVLWWLFPTGVVTHVLLVAALQNPTVRLRYLRVREVLHQYGQIGLYTDLLRLLGCAEMTAQQVEDHLHILSKTFDAAASVARTKFAFSSDITPATRSIAIDGSRNLIEAGNHREAVFWIIATLARCHKILAADAGLEVQRECAQSFAQVLAGIGISSPDDVLRRADVVLQFLPQLWTATEVIIAANPGIARTSH
jgi:hypothetical protein